MQETQFLPSSGGRLSQAEYGSDLAVELFAALGLKYVALNPGSSYRGLHDSFVNFPAADRPEMIICCHEEIAVAVAHGYARATGEPMLAALHNVVGLQHATMAIYNAWCDRVPLMVIGGTGPMASENRRNHIDWVHTANLQGNIVRDIVKWDDQPFSVKAFTESIMRGYRITMTEPRGPVYLCFDVDLQEQRVTEPMMLPDVAKLRPPSPIGPEPDALRQAAELVVGAQFPVILAGSIGRHPEILPAFQELVELVQAPVFSYTGFALPSSHPQLFPQANRAQLLAEADVVLALDIFDISSALAPGISPTLDNSEYIGPNTKVININVWDLMQHSLTTEYESLHEVDLPISADSRVAVPMLLDMCREAITRDSSSRARIEGRSRDIVTRQASLRERRQVNGRRGWDATPINMQRVSWELSEVVKERGIPWTDVGARGTGWDVTDPVQVVSGGSGHSGGGLGEVPAAAVGSALGRKGRFCFATVGDGAMLMTPSSLWTASNLKLPLLYVINNNFAYGNDEGHQEHIAVERGRPVENKGVGIYIDDPRTDFVHLAKAFDVEGIGPITEVDQIRPAMERAVEAALENRPVLVDVHSARGRESRAGRG